MRFWIDIEVECNAKKVLGVACCKTARVTARFRVPSFPEEGLAILGGGHAPVLDEVRGLPDGWHDPKTRPYLMPVFLCSQHAVDGTAELKRKYGPKRPG